MLDLTSLPKTDLHVHLEGSIRATTLGELAMENGVPLPTGLRGDRYEFVDFPDFIRNWVMGLACLRRPSDFRRIAVEFCQDEAVEGIRYAEVHFSLPEHAAPLGDWDGPLEAVMEGLAEGGGRFGISCRVIVDLVRGLGLELSASAVEAAVRHRSDGVVGIGLGGSERFPPEMYREVFRRGREAGLHPVPHAGESGGPESVRGAVRALRAERIGHGIRLLEDPDMVAEVRELGIPLDVCPTSNVMTRVVPSMREHPLPKLIEAGLTVTLNSDDPAMFASPLTGEYRVAREVFGFEDARLAELAANGVRSSFADDETKAELLNDIDAWLTGPAPGGGTPDR